VAKEIDQQSVNLYYIRAAIEARTGIRLTLKEVRKYLVEEKLLTPAQARKFAQVFVGYRDFYEDYTGIGYVAPPEDPEELCSLIM
jgi:hypothetical protein